MENFVSMLDELDGVTKFYTQNDSSYLMLLKHIREKSYLVLYIADLEENFWISKQDLAYFEKSIDEMGLQADAKTLVRYISNALKSDSSLTFSDGGASINLKLKIGEAATINYTMTASVQINMKTHLKEFMEVNKAFVMNLTEAKENEKKKADKKHEPKKDTGKQAEAKPSLVGSPGQIFKRCRKIIKKGNMITPNIKNRTYQGMKFKMDRSIDVIMIGPDDER